MEKLIIDEFRKTSTFLSEKELCNFIEETIDSFCEIRLGSKLKKCIREYALYPQKPSGGRPKRVDFYIELDNGQKAIIECKSNRKNSSTDALSQIMEYSLYFNNDIRLIVVSGFFDASTQLIVERFKLPIELYFISKKLTLHYGKSR